jgi:hypothetical protein
VILISISCLVFAQTKDKELKPASIEGTIAIEDFNKGSAGRNLLNGDTGSFHAPNKTVGNDLIQSYSFEDDDDWSLRLDYDLTKKSGMVGYWTRLNNSDFSKFTENGFLIFYIRGNKENGFPSKLKVELKSSDGRYKDNIMIGGISENWKLKKIPLKKFSEIHSWANMHELVFVLSSSDFSPDDSLKGTIYIDNIAIAEE